MTPKSTDPLPDTGERILPALAGEISLVHARQEFAYACAQEHVADKTVVDVGCGCGYGSHLLSRKARIVWGIDRSVEAIDYCRAHYSAPNITHLVLDADSLLSIGRTFDVAVAFQIIEHLPDTERFVDALKAVVGPGGTVLISTPNASRTYDRGAANPFHCNEMNCECFRRLLSDKFAAWELYGIDNAARSRMRNLLQKTPLWRWGRVLGRRSRLKRAVSQTLGLTHFSLVRENIAKESADLFAVCHV